MNSNGLSRARAVAVFALLGFALPACALAQAKSKFAVSAFTKTLAYAPLWVADKKGFFQREGLNVEIVVAHSTASTLQSLASGLTHVALTINEGVIGSVEKGRDFAIVAAASKALQAIYGAKNIRSYRDLRGATVGSSIPGAAFLLRRILQANGLEYPKGFVVIELARGASPLNAVRHGKVAAALLDVPDIFRAQEIGLNLIGAVNDVLPNYLFSGYAVRRQWAAKNRADIVRFVKALLQARKLLEDHPDVGALFLAQEFGLKAELARRVLDYYIESQSWGSHFAVDMAGLRAVTQVYAEQAEMKGPLPSPKKYVDPAYLNGALQELGWRQ